MAVAHRGDPVTLALAVIGLISRRALRNIQIVDLSSRDIVDKAWR
jgi:hypothetical protein